MGHHTTVEQDPALQEWAEYGFNPPKARIGSVSKDWIGGTGTLPAIISRGMPILKILPYKGIQGTPILAQQFLLGINVSDCSMAYQKDNKTNGCQTPE